VRARREGRRRARVRAEDARHAQRGRPQGRLREGAGSLPVFVSLLRAVNVGGQRAVPMAALRTVFEALGHRDVVTYVQSGNVVSTSTARRAARVAVDAQTALHEQLGLDPVGMVRSAS